MPTAAQLLKQIAELQSNLKVAKAKEQEELEKEIAKIRPRADALLQEKFGYTLAQIFTARDPNKPRTEYVHPETKEVFVPGKGKKRPDWVRKWRRPRLATGSQPTEGKHQCLKSRWKN